VIDQHQHPTLIPALGVDHVVVVGLHRLLSVVRHKSNIIW
jgi:hypothetical protein